MKHVHDSIYLPPFSIFPSPLLLLLQKEKMSANAKEHFMGPRHIHGGELEGLWGLSIGVVVVEDQGKKN